MEIYDPEFDPVKFFDEFFKQVSTRQRASLLFTDVDVWLFCVGRGVGN
jgi:hypothetical protein